MTNTNALILVALRDALSFSHECSLSSDPSVPADVLSYNRMLKGASKELSLFKFPLALPDVPDCLNDDDDSPPQVVNFDDDEDEEDNTHPEDTPIGAAEDVECGGAAAATSSCLVAKKKTLIQRGVELMLAVQLLRRRPDEAAAIPFEDLVLSPQETSFLRNSIEAIYIAMPGDFCRKMVSEDDTQKSPAVTSITALLDAEFQSSVLRGKLVDGTSLFDKRGSASDPNLCWWQGDMSMLQVDAMVNPANCALLGCFKPGHRCLDNILHGKGGPLLRRACHCQLEVDGKLASGVTNGGCMVTPGFSLPTKYVFHTVGPCLFDDIDMAAGGAPRGGGRGRGGRGRFQNSGLRNPTATDRNELASCYESCLKAAYDLNVDTIAFCCISTGVFGYPIAEAASIAVCTCRAFLDRHRQAANGSGGGKKRLPRVIFNVFKDEDRVQYCKLLAVE